MSTTMHENRTVAQLKERAAELGVDDDPRVTRANGHRPKKADWVAVVVEAESEEEETQASMVRRLVLEGLSNQEIGEQAAKTHPGMLAHRDPATCVSRTIGSERNRETDWWFQHRETIQKHRPRIKMTTPSEDAEEES